ncbi:MAG: hypothetical protein ACLSAF_13905 [Intestinimonas sp.]
MKLTCALEGFPRPELVVRREYRNGGWGQAPSSEPLAYRPELV